MIFHPDLYRAVDGNHYVTSFDATRPFSPTTLKQHKFLKNLPYTIVDLNPGEGVVIPAYAYHAAFAMTFDSISLNSFLLPKIRKGPYPYYQSIPLHHMLLLKASRYINNFTGLKMIKLGPYEFI